MRRSTSRCQSACWCRALADDVTNAIDIARDLKVPVLSARGGTSQCGQTTGVALVIDNSKYLRNVLAFDAEARTVMVEPGMVLDHLNAHLKPHGLWFPGGRVDQRTGRSAAWQATTPAAHAPSPTGNMVHNVLGIDAWLADGRVHRRSARKRSDRTAQQLGRAGGFPARETREKSSACG